MAVKLILAFLSPKAFDSFFVGIMSVEFMKNFVVEDSSDADELLESFRLNELIKRLIPNFLDIMYVEFMKKFLLADSSEMMAIRC